MRGLKLMLFGIAVILTSGFLVVAEAAARYPSQSSLVWGLILGLGISFVGLLLGGGGERGGDERGADTGSDGRDDRRGDGPNDDESDEDGGDDDVDTADRDHYSESFFPPM